MATINFPIANNKEIEYLIKPDKKTVFPVHYSADSLEVGSYDTTQTDPIAKRKSRGWSSDIKTDTVWIGKDKVHLDFMFKSNENVAFEIASIAFEDGRTDFSNIFKNDYHMDGNRVVVDETTEFKDLSYLPFLINTSVRLPKTTTDFPGITLEAPYNYTGDKWSCNVVLSNPYFTGFVIHGGSASEMSVDSGIIQINDSDGNFFSLNSENGTVNVYFPNITLDTLGERDSDSTVFLSHITKYSIHCNLRFFLVDEVYEDLKSRESWTDSEANEQGFFNLEAKKVTNLESKILDVLSENGGASAEITEMTSTDIDDVMSAPLIEILGIGARSYDGLNPFQISGIFSVTDSTTFEAKYVNFVWQGTMTAYLMDENREPDPQTDTDVSSEVTIDPLGTTDGVPYVPTVSFRGGVDSKECYISAEK